MEDYDEFIYDLQLMFMLYEAGKYTASDELMADLCSRMDDLRRMNLEF